VKSRKEYQREYHKQWYALNRDRIIAQVKDQSKEYKQQYLDSKMRPCMDCGFIPSVPDQMDYDHRDNGSKVADVSVLVQGKAWAKVRIEIEKCDLICANCHRLRTAKRRGS
jgi:hypothetical protein